VIGNQRSQIEVRNQRGLFSMPVERHIFYAQFAAIFDERETQRVSGRAVEMVGPVTFTIVWDCAAGSVDRKGVSFNGVGPPRVAFTIVI
jgi:hypothetical protein